MLKLNASYSKKVPADGEFTSQSYHASIEVELPDGLSRNELQNRIHATFEMVRNSVEAELHGKRCLCRIIPQLHKFRLINPHRQIMEFQHLPNRSNLCLILQGTKELRQHKLRHSMELQV